MNEEYEGQWSGLMLDAEGTRARAELDLDEREGELQGRITFTLVDEEDTSESKGEVAGRVEDGRVTLQYVLESRTGEVVIEFEGESMKVEHHAQAAIFGTYRVRAQRGGVLSGGVAILWKFAKQPER